MLFLSSCSRHLIIFHTWIFVTFTKQCPPRQCLVVNWRTKGQFSPPSIIVVTGKNVQLEVAPLMGFKINIEIGQISRQNDIWFKRTLTSPPQIPWINLECKSIRFLYQKAYTIYTVDLINKAQQGQKTWLLLYFIPPKLRQQLLHWFRCI